MRQNLLDIFPPSANGSGCSALLKPSDQFGQYVQLLNAKGRAASGDRDKGIHGKKAGPLSGQRGQPTRLGVEVSKVSAPIAAVCHQRELTSAEGVEGMGDPKRLGGTTQIGCN